MPPLNLSWLRRRVVLHLHTWRLRLEIYRTTANLARQRGRVNRRQRKRMMRNSIFIVRDLGHRLHLLQKSPRKQRPVLLSPASSEIQGLPVHTTLRLQCPHIRGCLPSCGTRPPSRPCITSVHHPRSRRHACRRRHLQYQPWRLRHLFRAPRCLRK